MCSSVSGILNLAVSFFGVVTLWRVLSVALPATESESV